MDGARLGKAGTQEQASDAGETLDRVFFALSDPIRRAILTRLEEGPLLVGEIARPFDVTLQAVSRHIQVLVRAGLVRQERAGRISRCRLEAGPIHAAAVWINRYSRYWQSQFDTLAVLLETVPPAGRRAPKPRSPGRPRRSGKVHRKSRKEEPS